MWKMAMDLSSAFTWETVASRAVGNGFHFCDTKFPKTNPPYKGGRFPKVSQWLDKTRVIPQPSLLFWPTLGVSMTLRRQPDVKATSKLFRADRGRNVAEVKGRTEDSSTKFLPISFAQMFGGLLRKKDGKNTRQVTSSSPEVTHLAALCAGSRCPRIQKISQGAVMACISTPQMFAWNPHHHTGFYL